MSLPLLPELTFHESRALSEAGLRHTAQLGTLESVRLPNGEYIETWVFGDPVPCRMTGASVEVAEIAAALGIKAQWGIVFKQSQDVTVGQQAMIRGETDKVAWQRLVEITADLGLVGRIHRRTSAVDVELNQ